MSTCNICLESFDHSTHKPYSLSSCSHTYCLSCLEKLLDKKCPSCDILFKEKHPNLALLEFIPESNFDKLKGESLKALIEINEVKEDLKNNRQDKLKKHQTKLVLVKKVVASETNKMIDILKQNEEILIKQCDLMLNELKASLDPSSYEDSISFTLAESKEVIEKNKLNEEDLKILNNKILEVKLQLHQLTDKIKKFENNYKYIPNAISTESLIIGKIEHDMLTEQDISNNESKIYRLKGINLKDLNKYEEAIQCFDKAIELNPNDSKGYADKAYTLCNLNKQEEAMEFFKKSIKLNLISPDDMNGNGSIMENLDKYKEAIECLEKVISINPKDSEAYYNKGYALMNLKRYDEAIQYYNKSIELNPNDSTPFNDIGMIFSLFNRFEEAIESYNKGIKANPKDFNIYNSKGAALKSLNRIKEALKCFNKAIEINPTVGSHYYNKGESLCELKKYEEAISSYDKAIELIPYFEPAQQRRDVVNFLLFLQNS